jgi:NodT family efflux transporter outer membrane factor (OMF) lipoprotein
VAKLGSETMRGRKIGGESAPCSGIRWALWPLWVALATVSGCAVGPDFVRPKAPAVERYTPGPFPEAATAADGKSQRFLLGARMDPQWWRLFSSPTLDAVVTEAIANNQTLQAAQASLRQSQYILRAGYGVFFPQLDATFDAVREKFSSARFGGSGASIFNLFTLTGAVSYSLDVFGGERRTVEGLAAQEEQQRALMLGSYLTLTGNVVNTVIAQGAYLDEIRATEELVAIQLDQVDITRAQVLAGVVPYANLVSLESQLASVEATLPPLRQRLSQAEHLLATLAGRAPAARSQPAVDLSELVLPQDLPVSLPSELVRQRPDILAAEAQLHSASAGIGVATAALFPSFTLSGSYGQNSTAIGDLMKRGGNFWSAGADLTAPIFHGGTLWFNRKAAMEGYQQSLAEYRQTVLTAFAQVADVLRALEHDAEAVTAQSRALDAAREALQLVTANYSAGTVGYLPVLVANAACQQAQIGYLQAKAQRYQDTVALFVALGGGWWEKTTRTETTQRTQRTTRPFTP